VATFDRDKWILKYLMSRLSEMWGWWPPRREVLDAAFTWHEGKMKWRCATCPTLCERGEREVDHIDPVGPRPKVLSEYMPYADRKLCPKENLRVLCKPCHKSKTGGEAKARAVTRKANKNV
jgi:hypothetical protein